MRGSLTAAESSLTPFLHFFFVDYVVDTYKIHS